MDNSKENPSKNEELEKLEKRRALIADIKSTIVFFIIVLIITFLLLQFVGQRTTVSGSSMEDTLSDGDSLIIDKISYRISDPKRFDIIVFPYEWEDDTYYIKRIIGMPGEVVRIDLDGNIFINEVLLEEDFGLARMTNPGMAIDPIYLSDDEYFVLGDNRNNSSDSRVSDVGPIHRKRIVGRAWIRIYPFNEVGFLRHGDE